MRGNLVRKSISHCCTAAIDSAHGLTPPARQKSESDALTSSSGHAADDGGGDDDGVTRADSLTSTSVPEPERLGQSHAHFVQFFCCLLHAFHHRSVYWQQRVGAVAQPD